VLVAVALSGVSGPAVASKTHEHGVARLDIAVEGRRLTIAVETPLDNLLGFEHAPRTATERRAADAVVATLKAADRLFRADAAARCVLSGVELRSGALGLGKVDAASAGTDGHGDIDGQFEFTCEAAPVAVDVGLFEAFQRLGRIEVQAVGAKGQRKVTLRRPVRRVDLPR
jgi:hypothetical protein